MLGGAFVVLAVALQSTCLPVCGSLRHVVDKESNKYGLRPHLLAAVAWVETRCDSRRVGAKGELGAWGILPQGSAARGFRKHLARPDINGHLAARHLRRLLDLCDGDESAALSVYSANHRHCDSTPTRYSTKVLGIAACHTSR